ncbi:biotin synthase [Gluconobacter japonicus]|uniref:methyltransferase domain-containing protein n=1 Tax=Gluconobacter japonicus TaxID=376620 RepID=UPI00078340DF|nr:methyltransferase domain-containing protein [Gluconobacter japonicus]KXV39586.1 biotin synthase [Gluconobacter japonicus]
MDERKHQIAQRFDAAQDYNAAADIQYRCAELLAERIREELAQSRPTRILEFGCGTGFLTEKLSASFPDSALIATDLAPGMITRAQERLTDRPVTFRVMDGEYPDVDGPFELIASSLCFQWFENRQTALQRLCQKLAPGGSLMLTTLLPGSLGEWRSSCEQEGAPCGVPSYTDASALQREWPEGGSGTWEVTTLHDPAPNARTFLHRLRQIGASLPQSGSTPASLGSLRRAMRHFDRHHQAMTYRIGLGIFRKDTP